MGGLSLGELMMVEYNPTDYQICKFDRRKYEDYEPLELVYFVQDAQTLVERIYRIASSYVQAIETNSATVQMDQKPIRELTDRDVLGKVEKLATHASNSMQIQRDWSVLRQHLDKNPTIREEWEALMMAIKLTEEDDNDE